MSWLSHNEWVQEEWCVPTEPWADHWTPDCTIKGTICFSEESSRSENSMSSLCGSTTTHSSGTQERRYQTHYEEGCDVCEADYVAWLLRNHPESVPPRCHSLTSTTSAVQASCSATEQTASEQIPSAGKHVCKSLLESNYICSICLQLEWSIAALVNTVLLYVQEQTHLYPKPVTWVRCRFYQS